MCDLNKNPNLNIHSIFKLNKYYSYFQREVFYLCYNYSACQKLEKNFNRKFKKGFPLLKDSHDIFRFLQQFRVLRYFRLKFFKKMILINF